MSHGRAQVAGDTDAPMLLVLSGIAQAVSESVWYMPIFGVHKELSQCMRTLIRCVLKRLIRSKLFKRFTSQTSRLHLLSLELVYLIPDCVFSNLQWQRLYGR